MNIVILFLVCGSFGQSLTNFENREISPKYNESCDAPENAKRCENKCTQGQSLNYFVVRGGKMRCGQNFDFLVRFNCWQI